MKFIWNDIKWLCIYTYLCIYDGRSTKGKTTTMSIFIDFPRFFRQSTIGRSLGFPSWNSIGRGQATNQVSTSHGTQNWGLEMGSSVHQISWFFWGGNVFFVGSFWLRLGFFRTFRLPLIHLQKWKVGKYEDDTRWYEWSFQTCLLSRVEHSNCKLLSP